MQRLVLPVRGGRDGPGTGVDAFKLPVHRVAQRCCSIIVRSATARKIEKVAVYY